MNFSKRNVSKKRKTLTSKSPMLEKKAGVSFLRIFFICFILLVVVGGFGAFGIIRGLMDNAPDVDDINIMPSGYATFIYDAEGNQLQKLTAPNANRMSVSLDQIPEDLQHAVVAIEDSRFYEHNGIDFQGILRAAAVGIGNGFNFTEGASTITQQLLKNNVFTDWTKENTLLERLRRKFQEQYLAVQLEAKLQNKDIIMENYLNTINLGAGSYGVQAAAKTYFNKDVWDLTLSEVTVIAGITQNPSRFNPIRHPDYNAERRQKVLNDMVEQKYITQEQADECLADDVYARVAAAAQSQAEESTVYSYFVDELTKQIVTDLEEQKGYSESQAYQALYSGGLRIYTTQDQEIQQICDDEYSNEENFPSGTQYGIDWALSVTKADGTTVNYSQEMMAAYFVENESSDFDLLFDSQEDAQAHIDAYKASVMQDGDTLLAERCSFSPQPQSSVAIMDQHTGYVKAIVGGRGEKTASLTLNRATSTYRQPGSTFKILSTYAPALNEFDKSLASTYVDEPYAYEGGRPVSNWDTNSYRGETTIRDAIINSVNVVAVKCITEITPATGIKYLEKFGFSRISQQNDNYQPLALGGIYNGVSDIELTAAYAAIANGGVYTKPIYYTKVLDQNGNIVLDNTPETTQVIKDSTAYLLTSAMEDVVSEGTGTPCQLNNMAVAGKTGTTSSYNDIWFAGFTPYYTCAIWAGYDNNEKLPSGGIYHDYHKILWRNIMSRIHENLEYQDFDMPASVEKATICGESGLLAGSGCRRVTEYFAKDTLPAKKCTQHYVAPSIDSSNEGDDSAAPGTGNTTVTPTPAAPTALPTPPSTETPVTDPGTTVPDPGTTVPEPDTGDGTVPETE